MSIFYNECSEGDGVRLSWLCLSFACGSVLPMAQAIADFTIVEVAQLSPADVNRLVFGDTDHDGRYEVICAWRDESFNFYYLIQEEQSVNNYIETYRGAPSFPLAAGDLDNDGKSDLVGAWGAQLQVFESTAANSHPTDLVWTYAVPNFLVPTAIADTDRDGNQEIIYFLRTGASSTQLTIFECVGDNLYSPVFALPTHNAEEPIIGDLDDDGLVEIAFCGQLPGHGQCQMTVVESDANDSWRVTFSALAGLRSGGYGQGGRDTDGNGKVELFFSGLIGRTYCGVVYEAADNDAFEHMASLYFGDNSSGFVQSALGNLDGTGAEEYMMAGVHGVQIFRPIAYSTWLPIHLEPNPAPVYAGVYLFDVNQNGIPELFRPCSASDAFPTLAFEQKGIPTATETEAHGVTRYKVGPIPSYGSLTIQTTAFLREPSTLRLFNAAGALIDRRAPSGAAEQRIIWTPRVPTTGVYFLRLETPSGGVETRKVTFVR